MEATKATWTITAGIILGQPMDEYKRVYIYTSDMAEQDKKLEFPVKYHFLMNEAYTYARTLNNPGLVNWVDIQFIWY